MTNPSGYEVHRRLSPAAAHARESSDLRAKIAELRRVLAMLCDDERKFVAVYREDVDDYIAICNFCKSSHRDEYQIEHKPTCPIAQACAALARCGVDGGGEEETES